MKKVEVLHNQKTALLDLTNARRRIIRPNVSHIFDSKSPATVNLNFAMTQHRGAANRGSRH
jgi:hypothetical protein